MSRRSLLHAFDEARFGPMRTLNLRAMLPTPEQAVARAEAWLREQQMSGAGRRERVREVLIITGRGNRSADGVSVVREAVIRLLASLRRHGVVAAVTEHTPGSFVVALAPPSARREAPRRIRRTPVRPPAADPQSLAALAPETRALLRQVAMRALERLGVRDPAPFVEEEMLAQFSYAAAAIPEGAGAQREERLRAALSAVLAGYEDG